MDTLERREKETLTNEFTLKETSFILKKKKMHKRYLEVLVRLQRSDSRVRELDMVQRPVGAVFVVFSTGEPVVVLLPERSHRWLFSLLCN